MRKDPNLLARRVYLMNVPYDAHTTEIQKLVQEFAPVDKVVVPMDPKGFARGYAFVYLKKASDVNKVIEFVDGRHIRSRQIRAKTSLGGQELVNALQQEKNQSQSKK
jgi:RNA recognition motif-containing protein